ncbi:aspartate aminotransferase family protein [Noviherbaspirillum malthae]|jgi:4-aminobutyrate aminotransferase|uniref:aspartate aminotransferase family protein n=1 Tax=Noviherbaspirillum malthae TaxID=1260987 RepID=UPI0018905A14|nr:aspartate aminotransferase family protein [Noviherbaspirillum malthae]
MNALLPLLQDPPFYYPVSPISMVRGRGLRLHDDEGREYLDCVSGTFNLILGHNHPEVVEAAKLQMDELVFSSSNFNAPAVDALARALVAISPANLTRAHLRSPGGSTANEGAIRIAQHITGKRDVVTLFRSHLGQTFAMTGLSGFSTHRTPFPNVFPGGVQVPAPYCARCFYKQSPDQCGMLCVSRIDDFIRYASTGSVACVLVEPILGVGGNIIPPADYLPSLKAFCDERGILLIFDECQTGFGRCGHMFAADYFGVSPHIMTLAKGMSGVGLPIGAILTEDRLTGLDKLFHGFTNGGWLPAAAAALKTIEILQRPGFLENVRHVGKLLCEGLDGLRARYPFIGEVRGAGLMIGMEIIEPDNPAANLPDNTRALALQKALLQQGVIIRISEHGRGNVVEIRPALICTDSDIAEILQRFEQACAGIHA